MTRHKLWTAVVAGLAVMFGSVAGSEAADEPDHVVVQHCLIGFKRSVPGKKLDRTKKEAASLAEEILRRAREGAAFGELVREYTDDRYPGVLKIANSGIPRQSADERERDGFVIGFGDLAFSLDVDEIEIVKYDTFKSPYGWHVVKRLE